MKDWVVPEIRQKGDLYEKGKSNKLLNAFHVLYRQINRWTTMTRTMKKGNIKSPGGLTSGDLILYEK